MAKKDKEKIIEQLYNVSVEDLFKVAKSSIDYYLSFNKWPKVKPIGKEAATFVTLFEKGNLRGCIGSLKAIRPILVDVSVNAINAAFYDPRFTPLTKEELKENEDNFEIEISILSPLKKFEGSVKEWIEFIEKEKPGVFIQKGIYSATFLPDVWKQLPDPFEFMNHLALKAGMNITDWVDSEKFYYYTYVFKRKWKDIPLDYSFFKE